MIDARGTHILRMDSKGRIFVNRAMLRFFGAPLSEGAGVWCLIGPPLYGENCPLIIMSDYYANLISHQYRQVHIKAEEDTDAWMINALFDQVEIKSLRIQFMKHHRKRLSLPADDNRVALLGQGYCFEVWAYGEFIKKNKDVVDLVGLEEEEEENE